MESNILNQFAVNYKQILIDEIALEGLEGISVDLLWRRLRKCLSAEITHKMRARYWTYIVNCGKVSVYELPEPLPHVQLLDRYEIVDENSGHLKEPDCYLDGPYEFKPIEGEFGSSKYYDTRKLIPTEVLKSKPYAAIISEYGDTLALVAHKEHRWRALAPHMPISYLAQMTSVHYCMLELIGKSRSNGQSTVGLTNLNKITKDPKALFYIRKYLHGLDLIGSRTITMVIAGRGTKVLLVRLKRFNQPTVLTMPKQGVLHDVIEYLMKKPDYSEKIEVILKKGLITQKQNRRLQKTVNIFNFEERTVIAEEKGKKTKGNLKRKFIFLSSKSDESSESDEDSQEPPLKCQYKVGVSLMRQAYERVLDAGLEGLTQLQLAQLLGIEFYTSRSICKIFKQRNIVREYLEDKGKQRTARYIAIAATGEMDVKYAEEKKKFLEYLQKNKSNDEPTVEEVPQVPPTSEDDDIPLKRIKLEKEKVPDTEINNQSNQPNQNKDNSDEANTNMDVDAVDAEHVITEVKVLEGFQSAKTLGTFKKNPTLRQLTFANGIFKVLKDRQFVCGYITLSNLVAKEINEPPMDSKALKSFIQKLVTDGHIKIYKMKWPGVQKYSVLICAPHVKPTDPLMKAKYKEICMRAVATKKMNIKKDNSEGGVPCLAQFSYPRYMKIQKLHEFLTKFAYFEYVPPESHTLSRGFVSIVDFIQEVTIEFVINNLGTMGKTEINQLIKESHLQMKLKDVPKHIYGTLLGSNTLQNALRLNLKVLAMLGLIQLVKQPAQSNNSTGVETYTSFLFFVNRRATILDTTGIWPRTTEEEVTEKSYYFDTFEDVTKYWNDVYQISINTVIEVAKRGRKQLKPPQRLEEEVQIHDTGARYGDGNGPCGFDSCFYMEIPRLWQTYYMRPAQSHTSQKNKITVKLPKLKISKKPKPKPPPKAPVERFRIEKLSRRRNDGTIRWSKQDDMIITMCKAAIAIMSPNSQPGSVIVRNIAAKDILSITDPKKTKVVCHRRALALESDCSLIHEKQCIINELRRRPNLIQKYEGLLKKLKIQYSTNMSKFINKARIPMMELVWLISEVMRSKSYFRQVPCVALDLEDFHKHFTIITSMENKLCNMFRIPENIVLKETIVLTIMQTLDSDISTEMGKKIYNTFKKYPEKSLRAAVDQLRKCGAIAAKEKIFNNQMHKQDLEDICHSSYKISALYQRKWSNRLNSDYVDNVYAILDAESENDVKGSAEMNTVYCEMHAYDVLDIVSTTVPVITAPPGAPIMQEEISVLTIDTKYKLKTGTLRLKNKSDSISISDLYKHLDTDNGVKYLSSYTSIDGKEIIKSKLDTEDPIVQHLNEKAENGATFAELQNITGFDDALLIKKLQELEMKKVAKRVGFYENVIVLTKHIKPWTVKIGDKYIVVTPWLTLNGKIKLEIFFKWCGVVMNLIFEKPGSSIVYLSEKCEFLTYRAVQDICMFLEKYECISLCSVKGPEVDLFSDEDCEQEITEFNPYVVPEKILAHPLKNSLTIFCYVKKKILDSQSDDSLMDKLFKC